MSAPEILREQFVNQIFGVVLFHLDFLEDHLLFLGDVFRVKARVQDEVGKHVARDRKMLVEHFRVEAGHLLGRERIEHSADGVHRLRDFLGGALARALEHHVLDEMGDAVPLGGFGARS
jgi:hypothetical protein